MADAANNVLLPMAVPDTSALRKAVAAIIRDIQREHDETDQRTADRLGVHKNTVANARNETADLGALTIAKIGAIYGAQAVNPYNALYGATARALSPSMSNPLPELAKALSIICEIRTPKDRLDALPALKAASASLDAFISNIETLRLVAA